MTPEAIVQRQVEAYNNRDIDAFALCHHPEVELYELGNPAPFAVGREKIREVYADIFHNSPELHTHIITRIQHNNIVIDKERITGRKGRESFEMMAIYEVEDGMIRKARFIR